MLLGYYTWSISSRQPEELNLTLKELRQQHAQLFILFILSICIFDSICIFLEKKPKQPASVRPYLHGRFLIPRNRQTEEEPTALFPPPTGTPPTITLMAFYKQFRTSGLMSAPSYNRAAPSWKLLYSFVHRAQTVGMSLPEHLSYKLYKALSTTVLSHTAAFLCLSRCTTNKSSGEKKLWTCVSHGYFVIFFNSTHWHRTLRTITKSHWYYRLASATELP